MHFPIRVLIGMLAMVLGTVQGSLGQPTDPPRDSSGVWHEEAWTSILEENGLQISYIYYPNADNQHDGVVLRLVNNSSAPLRYGFTLIFRASEAETTVPVHGRLRPGRMKTGEAAGLFWIPFKESDRTIGEIGLRGLDVARVRPDSSGGSSLP